MATVDYVKLAQTLPPKLLRFFRRYPPGTVKAPFCSTVSPSFTTPNPTPPEHYPPLSTDVRANPFQSTQNPITGAWRDPVYSLRRQADLVKLARENGVEGLLPFTVKSTGERAARQEERAQQMMGGRKVKGHYWERTQKGRLEKRRQAMVGMPELIRTWKEVGSRAAQTRTGYGIINYANTLAARPWTWVEEVPPVEAMVE